MSTGTNKTTSVQMSQISANVLKLLKARYKGNDMEEGFIQFVAQHEPALITAAGEMAESQKKIEAIVHENAQVV